MKRKTWKPDSLNIREKKNTPKCEQLLKADVRLGYLGINPKTTFNFSRLIRQKAKLLFDR